MLKPINLLITGGTGFFGRALLREHAKVDNTDLCITVISRSPEVFRSRYPDLAKHARWIKADITNPDLLKNENLFDYILHAAGDLDSDSQGFNSKNYKNIVEGTENMLRLAVKSKVSRFLFVSSGAIYGQRLRSGRPAAEDIASREPVNQIAGSYSTAKLVAENLCELYMAKFGLHINVARCFSFVGRDLPLDSRFAIGNFIRDALWKNEIVINGDGSATRSYLDQSDLAIWLMKILRSGRRGQAYNVGSDEAITIAQLAKVVQLTLAPSKQVRILENKKESDQERSFYVPDISLIKRELNVKVSVPLRYAILNAAHHAKYNRNAEDFYLK